MSDWDNAVRESNAPTSTIDRYFVMKDLSLVTRHLKTKAGLLHEKLTANEKFDALVSEIREDTVWSGPSFTATVEGTKEKWTGRVFAPVDGSWVEIDQGTNVSLHGELDTLAQMRAALAGVFPDENEDILALASAWLVASDLDDTDDVINVLTQIRGTDMPVRLLAAGFGEHWLQPFISTGLLSPKEADS